MTGRVAAVRPVMLSRPAYGIDMGSGCTPLGTSTSSPARAAAVPAVAPNTRTTVGMLDTFSRLKKLSEGW